MSTVDSLGLLDQAKTHLLSYQSRPHEQTLQFAHRLIIKVSSYSAKPEHWLDRFARARNRVKFDSTTQEDVDWVIGECLQVVNDLAAELNHHKN